jgi:UDP-glucose 4-epimerase
MVLPRFIAAAQASEPLKVYDNGSQTRCFCYVGDTVEALLRLQGSPVARGQVFNVGSTEEISILDLAKLVVEILKSKSAIEFISYNEAYAPGFEDMRRRKPVVDKLFDVVKFLPATPLRRIIELTASRQ